MCYLHGRIKMGTFSSQANEAAFYCRNRALVTDVNGTCHNTTKPQESGGPLKENSALNRSRNIKSNEF